MNHLYAIGIIFNYDPVKQSFILGPYHNPSRPLCVPQEALNRNDGFLLNTHVSTSVANFLLKMNKLVKTPLDVHSRSLHTSILHEHYSIAQLNFVIAEFSSFILKNTIQIIPSHH